jgi:hypothetical protein
MQSRLFYLTYKWNHTVKKKIAFDDPFGSKTLTDV